VVGVGATVKRIIWVMVAMQVIQVGLQALLVTERRICPVVVVKVIQVVPPVYPAHQAVVLE